MNRILFATIGLTTCLFLTSCVHRAFIGGIPSNYNGEAISTIVEPPVLLLFFTQYYDGETFSYYDNLDIYSNEIEWFTDVFTHYRYYDGEIILEPIVDVTMKLESKQMILNEIIDNKEDLLKRGINSLIIINQRKVRKLPLRGFLNYDLDIFFVNVTNPDLFGHAIINADGEDWFGESLIERTYKHLLKENWVHDK